MRAAGHAGRGPILLGIPDDQLGPDIVIDQGLHDLPGRVSALDSCRFFSQQAKRLFGRPGLRLEQFSITLTQLLRHAPPPVCGASSMHRECSGNTARSGGYWIIRFRG